MLIRAPNKRQLRLVQETARIVAQTASDAARGSASAAGITTVGGSDPTTGEFVTYGLIGLTPLGAPFRVKGS